MANDTKLAVPTVHLNGTGAAELMEQYQTMWKAVFAAISALRANGPHGRDYYVQDQSTGDSYIKAAREHKERLLALEKILTEIETIQASVTSQAIARNRSRS